jgi:hypothetical protein
MKPIPDKAEVALEYPDKVYIGTFEQSANFDAHLDDTGVFLTLHRGGDESVRKSMRVHIGHGLFVEILADLAKSISRGMMDENHRAALAQAATALAAALHGPDEMSAEIDDVENMTPTEEVTLLHVME